jgi:hypothetical protein
VSLPLIRDITQLRCSGVKRSMIISVVLGLAA